MASLFDKLTEWLRALLGLVPPPSYGALRPRVLMIALNPVIDAEGGRKLTQVLNWNDPDRLAADYIRDLAEASYGLLQPEIVERLEADEWPVKKDGYRYDDSFVQTYRNRGPFHQPDLIDYESLVRRFNILGQVASQAIDEVWFFAFPYAGFRESIMGGQGAFYCNSEPLENTQACPRRFIIMGFSYERGVGEMLENFGHRCESIMRQVYRFSSPPAHMFRRFCLYDKIAPGQANCGTIHTAPNGEPKPNDDRDWTNLRFVASNCDDWLNYPNFTGVTRQVNAAEWGNGDARAHHLWWLKHFPHVAGATSGISNNWWSYVTDPNLVR